MRPEPEQAISHESVLSGRVITAYGRPAAGAVLVLSPSHAPAVYSNAAEDGSFVLKVEAGAIYHLAALPPSSRNLRAHERFAMGAAYVTDLLAPASELEIRMRSADIVSGIVLDADGAPAPSKNIEASSGAFQCVGFGHTDDHGFFEIQAPRCSRVDLIVTDMAGDACNWFGLKNLGTRVSGVPSNGPPLSIRISTGR